MISELLVTARVPVLQGLDALRCDGRQRCVPDPK